MILKNKETLEEVITEIMDDMFFIFPELDQEGMPVKHEGDLDGDFIDVGVHFNKENRIRLRIQTGLLTEMTANFTGQSPDEVDQEHLESTATETANIVGGNFLIKIDPDQNYRISIPGILDIEDAVPYEKRAWQICFITDNGGMLCWPEARN